MCSYQELEHGLSNLLGDTSAAKRRNICALLDQDARGSVSISAFKRALYRLPRGTMEHPMHRVCGCEQAVLLISSRITAPSPSAPSPAPVRIRPAPQHLQCTLSIMVPSWPRTAPVTRRRRPGP